jgi:autotransporter-associated beta strand protein
MQGGWALPININMSSGKVVFGNSAANTFASGLTLTAGTLQIGPVQTGTQAECLGNSTVTILGGSLDCGVSGGFGPMTKPSGAGWNWNGSFTFIGSNPLNLGTVAVTLGASPTVTVNASTLTVGGIIGDGGSGFGLTKAGAGTLLLTGVNTYSGATTISGGTLTGKTGGSCASSAVSVTSGKTLSVLYGGASGQWTCAALTTADSTSTVQLDFNSTAASTTVAPLVISGALTYSSGSPGLLVANSPLAASTSYPLISYGSGGGPLPTVSFFNCGGVTGTLRLAAGSPNVIWLDTAAAVQDLHWASGNATWATGLSDTVWKDATSTPQNYVEGDKVAFLDTDITTSPTITLNTTVTPGIFGATNSTFNYTISGSGSIAGAGLAVTKAGSGNLTLDVDNSYTGSTLITAGRLVVGNGNNRGTIASSSGITDNGVLEFNRTGSDSYSLVIGGTGSLVKNGSSTLTLSGASTYSGGTTLSSGQLNINNGVDSTHSAIGTGALTISGVCTIDNTSGGGITLNPNMAINMNADFTYVGSSSFNTGTGAHTLGGNRQITVNGSFITLNGVIGDGGNGYSLTKSGSGGILVLAKANTYSGGTTLNAGTLYINNATGLGAATGTFTINGGTIGNTSGATITTGNYPQAWNADFSMAGNNDLNLGTGAVTLSANRQVSVGGTLTLTVGGVIGDGGSNYSLTKAGTGTLALTGVNTYGGKTTVNGGTLSINSDGSLGPAPGSAVADQLTLNGGTLNNITTDATLAASRGITLGASGGTISVASGRTMLINGNITGPGALLKTYVSGTTVNISLNGHNDFAGDFTITGGGLRFNTSDAAGTGKVIVDVSLRPSGGTANVTLRSQVAGTITLTNDVVFKDNSSGQGITLDAGPGTGGTLSDTFVMSGKISGPGVATRSLNSGNVSTVSLTGDNSAWSGGLTLTRYATSLGHKNALGTGPLAITPASASPSQVYLRSSTDLTGANAVANAITINPNGTAAPHLIISGSTGLELSGPVTLTGSSPTIQVDNTAATILSGVISGTGLGIVKTGTGTLTLKGANTYDGGTTVSQGTLLVSNTSGSGTGSGAVLVNSGATLGGSGTISGAVTVASGGTLAPGASIGTLTFGSSLALSGATTMEIDRGAVPNADKIVMSSGTVTLGGTLNVSNIGGSLLAGDTFDLIDGTIAGSFSSINLPSLPTGLLWDTSQLGAGGNGTIKVVCSGTLAASAGANKITCSGAGVVIGGSPTASGGSGSGYTYSWSPATGLNDATLANPTASPTSTTTYTVTATDSVGCTAQAMVTVNVDVAPSISSQPANTTVCAGSPAEFSVTASGSGLHYSWAAHNNGGWGSAWSTSGSGSTFRASSTDDNFGDPACTGFSSANDINSPSGNALGMWGGFSGDEVAIRTFAALASEQVVSIDFDNGNVDSGSKVGFSLQTSGGADVLQFYFLGGASNYKYNDGSESDTGIPFQRTGLRVQFVLTSGGAYKLVVTPCGGSPSTFTGSYSGTIAQLKLFNQNTSGGNDHNIYFNNFLVGGYADNADNYSGDYAGQDKGDQPIVSGNGNSNYTTPALSTPDNGQQYEVVVYGCGGSVVSSAATVTVNPPATVSAGPNQTVCASSPATTLAGSFGGAASSATWSGAGTFAPNNTTLNATYTPTAGEISAGSAIVTLTTDDPAGPCPAVNSSMTITINPVATVSAGPNQTVCASSPATTLAGSFGGAASSATWSGAGTFSPNNTTLNATYTPTAGEIAAGSATVTLTTDDPGGPCPAVSSSMTITINPAATVSAGPNQTVCASSPATTLAGSFGGAASSATWSGAGTFAPNNTTLNATYTPTAGEISAGSATVTLTTDDPAGPCGAVNSSMTITINPVATVSAGPNQTVCASSPATTLAGSFGGAASSATWSGAGTFAPNNTTLNATYTPTAGEISAGSATVTLTTDDPAGPCGAVNSSMTITINPAPTANAGSDKAVCAGGPVSIGGSPTASGGTGPYTYLWAPATGLSDATVANPTATIAAATTYTVTVTDANNCTGTDSVSLTIIPQPVIQSITQSGTDVTLVWSSLAGSTYRVQYRNNLDDVGWTDLTPDVTAGGATATKMDSVGSQSQRFYRVSIVCP